MSPPVKAETCGTALTEMEIKARELGKNGGLKAYMVVLREVKIDAKGDPQFAVRTLCFTAPSWSHVAAKYDHPEKGVDILKQEFLAPGEVSVLPLAWQSQLAELVDMSGLNMCYNCLHDYRNEPDNRCHAGGHRTDREPAERVCSQFKPKQVV